MRYSPRRPWSSRLLLALRQVFSCPLAGATALYRTMIMPCASLGARSSAHVFGMSLPPRGRKSDPDACPLSWVLLVLFVLRTSLHVLSEKKWYSAGVALSELGTLILFVHAIAAQRARDSPGGEPTVLPHEMSRDCLNKGFPVERPNLQARGSVQVLIIHDLFVQRLSAYKRNGTV